MKHFPENAFHLKKRPPSYSHVLSSLLPTLVCKKAEVTSVPDLLLKQKQEMMRIRNTEAASITSNITKKILSRRSTNALDRTTAKIKVSISQCPRPKSRVNKTIVEPRSKQLLDTSINVIKPQKTRKFRVKKLDEKYLRCPLPEMFSKNSLQLGSNNIISNSLINQAVGTKVIYFNSQIQSSKGIAILNINNFHTLCHSWKQPTHSKLSDQFKQILKGLSLNFSIVIKSQQIQSNIQPILSQISQYNINILAWINVDKSHSTNNKLYNLSDTLKILGTLQSVWIFEQISSQSTPRDLNKQIMLPVFKQSANVNLILYKKQDKQELGRITPTQLQKLKRVDSKQVIQFKQTSKTQRVPSKKQSLKITKNQMNEYDVDDYKSKLIQYLKILKNQKKSSHASSVNYLVGDLVKRNFKIFQSLLNNNHPESNIDNDIDNRYSDVDNEQQIRQQLKYQIQILSF